MVLRIKHIVNDVFPFQHGADDFGLIDGRRTDEDGLARFMATLNFTHDGAVLRIFCLVNDVGQVFSDRRLVCRYDIYVELINFIKFVFFRLGRTGHTGKLLIHAEVVLKVMVASVLLSPWTFTFSFASID